jgi:hypothetical protein
VPFFTHGSASIEVPWSAATLYMLCVRPLKLCLNVSPN